MIASLFVRFYQFWHGVLHLKGAGFLLTTTARFLKGLQKYPLTLPEGQVVNVNFLDVSGMYWLNHLAGDEFEERGLLLAIKSFLNDGDVVWDVGANSGLLCYQLAKMNRQVEIHYFEPNPRMFRLASEVVKPYDNLHGHEIGLSDREYEPTLVVPAGHATMGTLEPSATGRQGIGFRINCKTGDGLVFGGGFRPPGVIKIDTEGHEVSVISGLRRTISVHRPVIFFENISIDPGLLWSLVPSGYKMFRVSDATGELKENLEGGEGHNSVLVPQ